MKPSQIETGDRIAYTQKFLRQFAGDRGSAQRRGRVVAIAGEHFDGFCHWRTAAPLAVEPGYVLVQWDDHIYPRTEYGETITADLLRAEHVCRTRAAAFGDTW